jgi:hypothetical protein
MSFRRLFPVLALVCFVWLSAIPTRADGFNPSYSQEWNLSGALLIVGNDACGGAPCTETVSFSFDVGYVSFYPGIWQPYAGSNQVVHFSGDLGSFAGGVGYLVPDNYFAFGGVGAEIDVHPIIPITGPMGFRNWVPTDPPVFENEAFMYRCGEINCPTDFAPFPEPGPPPYYYGFEPQGPAVFTVTAIPEPATLTLLFFGILLLGLGGAVSRKF